MNGNDEIELIENNVGLYDNILLKLATKEQRLNAIKIVHKNNNGAYNSNIPDQVCEELSKIEELDEATRKELVELLKGE